MSRTRRRPYPSDLSNAGWALLEPLLASPERRGHPPKWPARLIADAVFYLLRSGCAWRVLPPEYPLWQTVYYHFRKWCLDGGGCGKPIMGCGPRCVKRKGVLGTRTGR